MILTESQYRYLVDDNASYEGAITNALASYTSIIEDYCNQVFTADDYTDTYYRVDVDPLILKRPNVNSLTTITVGTETADVTSFTTNLESGYIYHDGAWFGSDVEIAYNAGIDPPAVVKHVLATLVKGYLDGFSGGLNDLRPIVSESVYGVASYKYGGGYQGTNSGHAELQGFTTLLDKYVVPKLA
jgi:hypothetical protein